MTYCEVAFPFVGNNSAKQIDKEVSKLVKQNWLIYSGGLMKPQITQSSLYYSPYIKWSLINVLELYIWSDFEKTSLMKCDFLKSWKRLVFEMKPKKTLG